MTNSWDLTNGVEGMERNDTILSNTKRTCPSEHDDTAVIHNQLHLHRGPLINLLTEKLPAILQELLTQNIVSATEADQIRRKQRRSQRAVSLLDIISRKHGTELKDFTIILTTHCPQAQTLLNTPDAVIDSDRGAAVDQDPSETIKAYLETTHYGPQHLYNELKSLMRQNVHVTSIRFDSGFNLLHMIVKLDRLDLLPAVFYSGLWRPLYDLPTDFTTGPYARVTPMDLAIILKRTKTKEALSELNKSEIALHKIDRCVRSGDISVFTEMKGRYVKQIGDNPLDKNSLLEYACQSGSLSMLNEIIQTEKEMPSKRTSVNKALALCIETGQPHLLKPLLEYMSVDINSVFIQGLTPTEKAASNGDVRTFRELQNLGATTRDTIVALAAAQNRLPFLEDILKTRPLPNPHLNFQDKRGKTAAHFAAEKGLAEVLEVLIEAGHSLKVQDKRGYTILHAAAGGGSLAAVEAVLEASQRQGCLMSLVSSRDRYLGPERCFLVRGRDNDHAAWHYVETDRGLIDIFQRKTEGGSVDVALYGRVVKSGWGSNPSVEMIKQVEGLYDALNADPAAPADVQPVHVALIKKHETVALKLISVMDDVQQADCFGLMPLHLAAMRGYQDVIRALRNKSACRSVKDIKGRTPMQIAKLNDREDSEAALNEPMEVPEPQSDTAIVRRILSQAHANLSDEQLSLHIRNGQNKKLYVKTILRDVIADINEYLYDCLGEGPITTDSFS